VVGPPGLSPCPARPGSSEPGGTKTEDQTDNDSEKRKKISNRRAAFVIFRSFTKIPVSADFPIFYSEKSLFAGSTVGCQNDSFLNTRLPEMRHAAVRPAFRAVAPESTQVYATKAAAAVLGAENLKIFRPPPDSPAVRAGFFVPFYAPGTGATGGATLQIYPGNLAMCLFIASH
jgi:hypothetical protein